MADLAIGTVVIGRNEGERLRACLASVLPGIDAVVYVDSGSTDGSVDLARDMGAVVLPLDMAMPFTAARARNVGFRRLLSLHPHVCFVQFVDGDCEPCCPRRGRPPLAHLHRRLRDLSGMVEPFSLERVRCGFARVKREVAR